MYKPIGIDKFGAYNSLFNMNDEQEYMQLPIEKLVAFKNHPYHVDLSSEEVEDMMSSLNDIEIVEPVIVRKSADKEGFYEIISGHRRTEVYRKLGKRVVPCLVKDMDDYTATRAMNDTNKIGRKRMKPSELAAAYKLEYGEFCKSQNVSGRSDEAYADSRGISRMTVRRYIKLNDLTSDMLAFLDGGKMNMKAALVVAELSEDTQALLYSLASEGCIKIKSQNLLVLVEMESAGEEIDEETVLRVMNNSVSKPSYDVKTLTVIKDEIADVLDRRAITLDDDFLTEESLTADIDMDEEDAWKKGYAAGYQSLINDLKALILGDNYLEEAFDTREEEN